MSDDEQELKLTPSEREEYEQAFGVFAQEDGKLASEKIGDVLRTIGKTPTNEKVRELEGEADIYMDGEINFQQFLELYKMIKKPPATPNDVLNAFKKLDTEGTGRIETGMFKRIITNLGEGLSEEELEDMMAIAAPNEEEFVDYAAVTKIMASCL